MFSFKEQKTLRSSHNIVYLRLTKTVTMKSLLFSISALIICFNTLASVIYVDQNATGTNDGTNWTDAFDDLQEAIALSVFGDEIWVAEGTYKPTTGTSRTISFEIKNGTKIYGGFNGAEATLNERNVALNVTVLSGEIGTGAANDNSYRVVRFNNVANQTRLDGFTITSAYNNSSYGGGAVSVASSPIIANCIFAGNYSSEGGGALNHSTSGILTLENCLFDGNVGNTYGGGALRLYAGTVNISNCYFKSNQSNTYGGAIFIYNSVVNVSNSVFAGNTSQSSGSGIRVGDEGTIHLSNSLFVGNYSNTSTTIYASTFSNSSPHTIKNCTVAHNMQLNSGGSSTASTIALNSEATVTNSIIYGNIPENRQVLATGLTFNYNILESAASNAPGTNILYTDPQFVSQGNVNNAPFDTTGYNYRLNILSEGIDYGLNANVSGVYDLDGNTRIHNSIVDLGAYEKDFCVSNSEFTINEPYKICGGTPIILEVNDGVQYLWSTGSTNNSISVGNSGTYSVLFEDISGCRGNLTANVTSSPSPTPNINFSMGSLSTGTYDTYQWYFNGALIGGATNNTHTPIEGYGLYQVDVTNANGCEGSETYCLSPAELDVDGPTTFCEGNSVELSILNGDSQVWSTGSLSSTIAVNSSGTYSVTVLNSAAGCSVDLEQNVVVHSNPNPTINFDGENLSTSTFSSYQWNFNGNPISGATSQTIDPSSTGNGQYTVTVTNSNGCEATSNLFNLTNLGIDEVDFSLVEYYPNPITNGSTLTIILNKYSSSTNHIEIYNSIGEKVADDQSMGSENKISLQNLEKGLYFISVRNSEFAISGLKLIVL